MPNTYCEGLGEENTDLVLSKKLSRDHPYINSTENQQNLPLFADVVYGWLIIFLEESFRSLLLKFQ